jgi:hypothetical protein
VGVQKTEPFGVFPVEVTEPMLSEGRAKYQRLLRLLKAPATRRPTAPRPCRPPSMPWAWANQEER